MKEVHRGEKKLKTKTTGALVEEWWEKKIRALLVMREFFFNVTMVLSADLIGPNLRTEPTNNQPTVFTPLGGPCTEEKSNR